MHSLQTPQDCVPVNCYVRARTFGVRVIAETLTTVYSFEFFLRNTNFRQRGPDLGACSDVRIDVFYVITNYKQELRRESSAKIFRRKRQKRPGLRWPLTRSGYPTSWSRNARRRKPSGRSGSGVVGIVTSRK